MRIGEKLKEEREKNELSQKDVADRLHVARQSVSRWETDQSYPDVENLIALGRLYHVSLDELFGIEREEVIPESVQKKTEEEQPAEEENSAKRAELEWKEQGIVFAVALASCVFPLLGVFVPGVLLWKYRKRKMGVLLKILLVLCVLVSMYNCVVWIQAIFFESYYVNVEAIK